MNYTTFTQRMEEHNEVLRKKGNSPFYSMLLALSENLIMVTKVIGEMVGTEIKVSSLEKEAREVEVVLEEIEETFAIILEKAFEDLIMKQVYEDLDPLLATLDDLIEDLNEYGETKGRAIPYIEAWDIGFFYE